jgi:hypothetical protein
MNRASVAAGVSPAVEGGVSPPGIPGSWSVGMVPAPTPPPMNPSLRQFPSIPKASGVLRWLGIRPEGAT